MWFYRGLEATHFIGEILRGILYYINFCSVIICPNPIHHLSSYHYHGWSLITQLINASMLNPGYISIVCCSPVSKSGSPNFCLQSGHPSWLGSSDMAQAGSDPTLKQFPEPENDFGSIQFGHRQPHQACKCTCHATIHCQTNHARHSNTIPRVISYSIMCGCLASETAKPNK